MIRCHTCRTNNECFPNRRSHRWDWSLLFIVLFINQMSR